MQLWSPDNTFGIPDEQFPLRLIVSISFKIITILLEIDIWIYRASMKERYFSADEGDFFCYPVKGHVLNILYYQVKSLAVWNWKKKAPQTGWSPQPIQDLKWIKYQKDVLHLADKQGVEGKCPFQLKYIGMCKHYMYGEVFILVKLKYIHNVIIIASVQIKN